MSGKFSAYGAGVVKPASGLAPYVVIVAGNVSVAIFGKGSRAMLGVAYVNNGYILADYPVGRAGLPFLAGVYALVKANPRYGYRRALVNVKLNAAVGVAYGVLLAGGSRRAAANAAKAVFGVSTAANRRALRLSAAKGAKMGV